MPLDRLTQITSSGISSTSTITVSAIAGVITATSATVASNITINASGINAGVVTAAIFNGNVNSTGVSTFATANITQSNPTNLNVSGISTFAGRGINIGTGASISSPATNVLTLGTNNVEVARFDSSGRLGIGTNNPLARLQVNGSAAKTSAEGSALVFSSNDATNPFQLIVQRSASTDAVPVWSIASVEQNVAYRGLSLQPNGGNTLIGMGGGNLGIGTANPSAPLEVVGGTAVSFNAPAVFIENNKFLTFKNTTGNWALGLIADTGNYGYVYGLNGLIFGTGSSATERARIDSSGRVTMPYQPVFYAYQSGSVATSSTGIFNSTQWNTTLVNTGSYFNTSNGRFTAPVAGVYMFQIKALVRYVSSAGAVEISLYKNGSNVVGRSFGYTYVTGTGDHDPITAIAYISLAVNDYVQMGISSLSAGTDVYYGENLASFCGHLVG